MNKKFSLHNALLPILLLVLMVVLPFPINLPKANAAPASSHCHVTDGTFTTCPDGSVEWSDVTPRFFAATNSYLYADQAKLNSSLSALFDTFVLMYDECNRTVPLASEEYFLVHFNTVEVTNGVASLVLTRRGLWRQPASGMHRPVRATRRQLAARDRADLLSGAQGARPVLRLRPRECMALGDARRAGG